MLVPPKPIVLSISFLLILVWDHMFGITFEPVCVGRDGLRGLSDPDLLKAIVEAIDSNIAELERIRSIPKFCH